MRAEYVDPRNNAFGRMKGLSLVCSEFGSSVIVSEPGNLVPSDLLGSTYSFSEIFKGLLCNAL